MQRSLKLRAALRAEDPAAPKPMAEARWVNSPRAVTQQQRFAQAFGRTAQRKVLLEGGAKRYEPDRVPSAIYQGQYSALNAIGPEVTVNEGDTGDAEGHYTPMPGQLAGAILMPKPVFGDDMPRRRDTEFNANVGTLTHEMQHALDDLNRTVRFRTDKTNVLRTEWRAWAMQAAVTLEHRRAGRDVTFEDHRIMCCFKDKVNLSDPAGPFFKKTARYLHAEGVISKPSDEQTLGFMREHDDWLGEALLLFYSHVPEGIGGLDWSTL